MNEENKPPSCYVCQKTFSKNAYRNKHLRNVHKINSKGEKLPDNKHTCILCDKKFNTKFSLDRHINAIHFIETKTTSSFECDQCGYKTSLKANLKRHIKKHDSFRVFRHNRPHKCSLCNASFRYTKNLIYHKRKIHSVPNLKSKPIKRSCPICSFVSCNKNRTEINNHFQKVHNIPVRWETYNFDDFQSFNEWKTNMEKDTTTFYIEKRKFKHYICNRSGSYKKSGKNLRHIKITGTCKINAFCPSEILVNSLQNGSVEVRYLPCHVGHKNELKFIRLTLEEKKKLLLNF